VDLDLTWIVATREVKKLKGQMLKIKADL